MNDLGVDLRFQSHLTRARAVNSRIGHGRTAADNFATAEHFLLLLITVGNNAAMQSEPPKADPPKRKRHWFQFSLRTVLPLVTLACVVASWIAWRNHKAILDGQADRNNYNYPSQTQAGPKSVAPKADDPKRADANDARDALGPNPN